MAPKDAENIEKGKISVDEQHHDRLRDMTHCNVPNKSQNKVGGT